MQADCYVLIKLCQWINIFNQVLWNTLTRGFDASLSKGQRQ